MAATATPATRAAQAAGIAFRIHEYTHDPKAPAYGLEAAEALGVEPDRVFKTLVVLVGGELVVAIIPVAEMLKLKAVGKGAVMAPPERAERSSGYVVGGISPLGQRKALPTLIDETAELHDTVYVSAGRRGLEIELSPGDLVALTGARVLALT